MPSAQSFGDAFDLKRGHPISVDEKYTAENKSKQDFIIVRRSIGHEPITPNRVYRYPISLTISSNGFIAAKRKRGDETKKSTEEGQGDLKAIEGWFGAKVAGQRRVVWTFYGNPYDIWVEDKFTVKRDAWGQIVLNALGHGTRNFSAPKKPPTLQKTNSPKINSKP